MPTAIDPASVKINFGPNANKAVVTPAVEQIIRDNVAAAGGAACTVSSTLRNATDQARAMFDNLVALGVASQRSLYGPPGNQVIDTFVASKAKGNDPVQIKADMTATINRLGPHNVSRH